MKAECIVCGKEFEKTGPAKTCDEQCRHQHTKDRNRKNAAITRAADPEKYRRYQREYQRKLAASNPEKSSQERRRRYYANIEKYRERGRLYGRRQRLESRFGLPPITLNALFVEDCFEKLTKEERTGP